MTALGGAHGSANTKYSFFLLPAAQTGLLGCFQLGVDYDFRALNPEIWGHLPNKLTGGEDEPC